MKTPTRSRNARISEYRKQCQTFFSARFSGAERQRLWASTSSKDPNYRDLKYVEALIGPDTVNTIPLGTLNAYRGHGKSKARIEQDVKEARWVMERLPELGLRIDDVTQQLENEGVKKFEKPFDKLIEALEKSAQA